MSNTPKIDEIIKENIYDGHENCDDSCGKKADYTEFKNDLHQLILEVIGEDESPVDVWDEKEKPSLAILKSDTRNDLRQTQRQKLSELFNITQ